MSSLHSGLGPNPPLECPSHPFFEFHAEAVCNAVDEIKVGNDQGRIQNGPVAPARFSKKVDVPFSA